MEILSHRVVCGLSRIQIFLVEKALSVSAFTVRPISEKNFKRM